MDVHAWAASECKRAAFAEVAAVGAASGIPLLPVKGVLTAHLLYANPTERWMVDVDVRVRPFDLERLCVAGTARGWRLIERSRSYASAAFEVFDERVELEAHVGPPGFCKLSVETMIERAEPQSEPFGVPYLRPEIHDHTLLLMVNAFKDQLVAASEGGLTDLARIVALPGFSFDVLARRSRAAGMAALAWIVAEWMVERRRETRWEALKEALGGRPERALYAASFRALARPGSPPSLPLRLLVRAAPDSALMRTRALATTASWWLESLRSSPKFALKQALHGTAAPAKAPEPRAPTTKAETTGPMNETGRPDRLAT